MMKVCIDPGHGMSNRSNNVYDPGATHTEGTTRHEEATIALKYALTLKDAFRANGVDVFMTRDDATDHTPVGARASRAESAGCDAFISLHLNDFDDDSANGSETLYRDNDDRSLAQRLQNELISVAGLRDRGIKERDDLAVLRFDGPAALVELGFIANDRDRAALLDTSVRDRLCTALASATMSHMGWTQPGGNVSGQRTASLGLEPSLPLDDLKEHDWGGSDRRAYDLSMPLIRGEVPLSQESFRGVFGSVGVRENFNMAAFETKVRSWGLRFFSPTELLFLGASHYSNGACGGKNSLPPSSIWDNMEQTARMADEVRSRFGHPLRVLSAYRDADYNSCVGGGGGSHHRRFNALDLTPEGGSLNALYAIALQVRDEFPLTFSGGLGYYPGSHFIHIDTRGENVVW